METGVHVVIFNPNALEPFFYLMYTKTQNILILTAAHPMRNCSSSLTISSLTFSRD